MNQLFTGMNMNCRHTQPRVQQAQYLQPGSKYQSMVWPGDLACTPQIACPITPPKEGLQFKYDYFDLGLDVSLPREWFEEIKSMMTVHSTHGLFFNYTQESPLYLHIVQLVNIHTMYKQSLSNPLQK